MGIENWGRQGMPPVYVDVLSKVTLVRDETGYCKERSWIRGSHPHLGAILHGWSGTETQVTFCYTWGKYGQSRRLEK